MERLSMLLSHIRERKDEELGNEFPYLPRHERKKWEGTDFHCSHFHGFSPIIKSSIILHTTPWRQESGFEKPDVSSLESRPQIGSSIQLHKTGHQIHDQHSSTENTSMSKKSVLSSIRNLLGGKGGDNVMLTSNSFLEQLCNAYEDVLYIDGGSEVNETVCSGITSIGVSSDFERELKSKDFSLVVIPHVDCSTGNVLRDISGIVSRIRSITQDVKIALDITESVGIEDVKFHDWDLDFAYTTSASVCIALISDSVDISYWEIEEIEDKSILAETAEALSQIQERVCPNSECTTSASEKGDTSNCIEVFRQGLESKYNFSFSKGNSDLMTIVKLSEPAEKGLVLRHFHGLLHQSKVEMSKLHELLEGLSEK